MRGTCEQHHAFARSLWRVWQPMILACTRVRGLREVESRDDRGRDQSRPRRQRPFAPVPIRLPADAPDVHLGTGHAGTLSARCTLSKRRSWCRRRPRKRTSLALSTSDSRARAQSMMEVVLLRSSITGTATGVSATAERTESGGALVERTLEAHQEATVSNVVHDVQHRNSKKRRWVEVAGFPFNLPFPPRGTCRPGASSRAATQRCSARVAARASPSAWPGATLPPGRCCIARRCRMRHDQVTEFRSLMNLGLHRIPPNGKAS